MELAASIHAVLLITFGRLQFLWHSHAAVSSGVALAKCGSCVSGQAVGESSRSPVVECAALRLPYPLQHTLGPYNFLRTAGLFHTAVAPHEAALLLHL